MSGPKGIEYEIAQERRALERARARMTGLAARNRHLQQRGSLHGVLVPNVQVPGNPAGNSAAVNAACDRVEAQLREAESELERALGSRAVQAVSFDVDDDLARLVAEDEAKRSAAASAAAPAAAAPARPVFNAAEHARNVAARLREANTLTPEVQAIAKSALHCRTSEEARMALSGLSSAIAAADKQAEREQAQRHAVRRALAELRTEIGALLDPAALEAQLDGAERLLDGGADIAPALDRLRTAVAEQARNESAERDRRLVLAEVKNALAGLGYTPVDVTVATHDTVVRQPKSAKHAVRVNVVDGEIGLETVLTPGAASTPAENRAADEALCGDLDRLLGDLQQAGIGHGRIRKIPVGVVQPAELGATGATTRQRPDVATKPGTPKQKPAEPQRRRQQQRGGAR